MDILYILVFSVSLSTLGIGLIILSYFYTHLSSKFQKVEKENIYLRYHMSEKSLEKVNTAREKSLQIINNAISQANEIVNKAEYLKTDTNTQLMQELAELTRKQQEALIEASKDLHLSFVDALQKIEEEDINIFQNITKDIEGIASGEIKNFEKILHDETIGRENVIEEKTEAAFVKITEEINAYKKDRLANANKEINEILRKVSKEVLGKTMSTDDHRDLIMAALDRVKNDAKIHG